MYTIDKLAKRAAVNTDSFASTNVSSGTRGESALVHALAPAPSSPLPARSETLRRTGTPLAPHVQPPCLIRAPDVFQRKD
jgi:hypothetical protein